MNSRFCVLGGRLGNIGMPEPKERMKADVLCNVHFLDDTSHSFKISRQDSGQVLLDLVFSHLGLLEREFFSLQYSEDAADSPRWLDPNKPIKKQLKGIFPTSLSFRVRFFITDPNSLQQEQTRHLYFLQIKNDIQEGRLSCPLSSAVVLASYAVQAELGDHSPSQHSAGYLSGSHFLPQQDSDFQAKVESLHVQHRGLKKSEAELCFLNTARTLELYGVEMHCCRDPSQSDLLVGIASGGVAIFQNMICCNFFSWVNIIKVSFKRKRFFIQLRQKHGESKDHTVAFIMPSYRACKNLWKSCVEHHTFFQVKRSLPPGNKLLLSNCSLSSNPARSLNSHIYRKVLGGMVWNPMIRRSNSAEHLETKSLPARSPPTTPNWRSPRLRHEVRKPRHSSVDNLASEMSYITESEDVFYTYRGNHTPSNLLNPQKQVSQRSEPGAPPSPSPQKRDSWEMSPDEAIDSDTQSYGQQNVAMDSDLLLVHITPDEEGKFGFNVKGGVDQKMPLVISHVSADSPAGQSNPQLLEGDQIVLINGRDISEHTHNQVVMFIRASRESHSKELALLVRRKGVSLRMEPQPDFESGFPSLGQTILLPGDCGESMLHCGGTLEESMLHCGGTLEESMAHLRKGLQSGVLLVQFEQLYRKKPGMSVSVAKLPQNMEKNRYKDILPYDCSRVVLEEEGDDYINASHIQMETGVRSGEAGAGPVKRYVASQGPLPHTCAHFWRAIWEQGARLIVMLTTLTERGRPKCHQYWPDPPEVREYGGLQVCCHSEECNLAYVFREFTLTNTKVGEQRSLAHLQYVAWPDHGVPEDPSDFLDFVRFVRNKRSEAEPLTVHCSAGIGRTGVLITMETAMELIEKKQPVNPLDIVRRLRDQRPMMVQTASQYRFVCEAILRVFQERQQSSSPPDACS